MPVGFASDEIFSFQICLKIFYALKSFATTFCCACCFFRVVCDIKGKKSQLGRTINVLFSCLISRCILGLLLTGRCDDVFWTLHPSPVLYGRAGILRVRVYCYYNKKCCSCTGLLRIRIAIFALVERQLILCFIWWRRVPSL